jgi:hypothetical protein
MDECKALAVKADEKPAQDPAEDYDDGNITDETQTEDIF